MVRSFKMSASPGGFAYIYSAHLIVFLLLNLNHETQSSLLRTNSRRGELPTPVLDRSGWRIILAENDEDGSRERINELSPSERSSPERASVDWDDDDLLNANDQRSKISNDLRQLFQLGALSDSEKQRSPKQVVRLSSKVKHSSSPFSRLIFHGQVKANATKIVDGLRVHINARRPVAISRRFDSKQRMGQHDSWLDNRLSDPPEHSAFQERSSVNMLATESSSLSDWRPIRQTNSAPSTRVRRFDRTTEAPIERSTTSKPAPVERFAPNNNTNGSSISATVSPIFDTQWKPIGTSTGVEREVKKSVIVYGKKGGSQPQPRVPSRLEEPFERDEELEDMKRDNANDEDENNRLVTVRTTTTVSSEHEIYTKTGNKTTTSPTLRLKQTSADRWTPLFDVTTTPLPVDLVTARLTTGVTNSSQESAKGSASDLNYIYSSQPQQPQTQQLANQVTSSYYNQYIIQPTQPTMIEQPAAIQTGPIVDTSSGQVPEMISDRVPDAPLTTNDGYSIAAPQLIQSTPIQQPMRPSYPSYDYGSSYGTPSRQMIRHTTTGAPQVVKQEHHYHYYTSNPQQQQQPMRQQPTQQDYFDQSRQLSLQQQQPPQQQQTVIREIQPLLIGSSFLPQNQQQQQSSTTTPTPQIIREIIREAPTPVVQPFPIQVSRVMVAPPPPAPVPISFTSVPATQIMRAISNSIPTVSVRMPQIRFPALPLAPIRANPTTAVTRQTGTFMIPSVPKKTTTYLTETQAMPTHTTIMQTTQFTPATRTTVYTTEHQPAPAVQTQALAASSGYRKRRRRRRR